MTWATHTEAVAALRTLLQDDGTAQRYTDAELAVALRKAVADLSAVRPVLVLVQTVVDSPRMVRLDDKLGATVFGSIVSVLDMTDVSRPRPVFSWQYYEASGQHRVSLPNVDIGTSVAITVRGGYGFGIVLPDATTLDTNVPVGWRESLTAGAQGYALELYGAREVGRTNVAPAMAQQTARAAVVKLREFRQWLTVLPQAYQEHEQANWGLRDVDQRGGVHRGFD